MTADTPARQPQHCDHECVCYYVEPSIENDGESPCRITCEHDTRRTHTSPPAPAVREMFAEHQAYRNGYDDGYALAMNEAGDKIKAAREKVLDELSECFLLDSIIYEGSFIHKIIQSLRAQQGGVSE